MEAYSKMSKVLIKNGCSNGDGRNWSQENSKSRKTQFPDLIRGNDSFPEVLAYQNR